VGDGDIADEVGDKVGDRVATGLLKKRAGSLLLGGNKTGET
jgi:hypothetical protein